MWSGTAPFQLVGQSDSGLAEEVLYHTNYFPQTNKRDNFFLTGMNIDTMKKTIGFPVLGILWKLKILFFRLRPSDNENVPDTQYFDRNAHKRGQRAGGAFEKKNDKVWHLCSEWTGEAFFAFCTQDQFDTFW